jgi:hypothetical protein
MGSSSWKAFPLLILLAGTSASAQLTPRVLKQISREQRTQPPTFTPTAAPVLLDRGRLVHHGLGLWQDQHKLSFFRLSDGAEQIVEVPLESFFLREAASFPGASGSGFPRYRLRSLLFYDTDDRRAGLLLDESPARTRKGARRLHYLHWDLARRQITSSLLLGEESTGSYPDGIEALLYDPKRQELLCQVSETPSPRPADVATVVSILAISPQAQRVVGQVSTARTVSRGPFVDRDRRRALVAEYAERDGETPRGYLVDLETGKHTAMAIPLTTYGAAFNPDGKVLYLYGSKRGVVEARATESGKLLRTAKVGSLGHGLAWIGPGALLLLRNSGLQPLDAKRLTKRPFIPSTKLYPGFSHVEGSFALPGRVVIKNGGTIHLVELK